jgi:hypothetical protein
MAVFGYVGFAGQCSCGKLLDFRNQEVVCEVPMQHRVFAHRLWPSGHRWWDHWRGTWRGELYLGACMPVRRLHVPYWL